MSRKILAQGGVTGLWRGCWPNVKRAALVNLGDHSQYGLSVCMVRCFADVVKARIMNQATDQFGRGLVYKGFVYCAMKTVERGF